MSGQENITPHTPPVFLFESMDDRRISPQNSVMFAQALDDFVEETKSRGEIGLEATPVQVHLATEKGGI